MKAKQLGYIIESYNDRVRYTCVEKGITIDIDLHKAGRNTHVSIEVPLEKRYWDVDVRVNDAEEMACLLAKVKIIADTLRGNN